MDHARLVTAIRRVTQFGWPAGFPLVQFPNAALIAAFAFGQAAAAIHGAGHGDALAASFLAMTFWAYQELVHGVNWFRHLLGLVYIVSMAIHLAVIAGR